MTPTSITSLKRGNRDILHAGRLCSVITCGWQKKNPQKYCRPLSSLLYLPSRNIKLSLEKIPNSIRIDQFLFKSVSNIFYLSVYSTWHPRAVGTCRITDLEGTCSWVKKGLPTGRPGLSASGSTQCSFGCGQILSPVTLAPGTGMGGCGRVWLLGLLWSSDLGEVGVPNLEEFHWHCQNPLLCV
jgi:hypothetical protein